MNKLRKNSMYRKVTILMASMVMASFTMGLIFLAPIAIYKYSKRDKGYEAIVQMPAAPEKVFSAAVSMAQEKAPDIKIVKKEDENMFLEVTDGVQTASVTVKKAEEEGKTDLTILATLPKEEDQEKEVRKDKERELAHRIVYMMCTKLEVECTLTKE
ncbi:MAG: hypothetical protein WAV13_05255 [Thermodesulfovibrionales bacterium]